MPLKTVEFQTIVIPLEAPIEGEQTKESNLLGQKDLIVLESKEAHFVSCRQTNEHWLSSIFCLTALCLASEFRPLTFQQRTFQFLQLLLIIAKDKDQKPHGTQYHMSKRAQSSLSQHYHAPRFQKQKNA